jgi:integrase
MGTINKQILFRPDRQKKDGTFPLVLRIIINRKVKYFPIKVSVLPKDFNDSKQRVRSSDPEYMLKNQYISKAERKVASIEEHFIRFGNPNMDDFSRLFKVDQYNSDSLFDYIDLLISNRKNELADSTIDFYHKQKAKLKGFRVDIKFGDVNFQFLNDYKAYLINKGNKDITWNKSLEFLRRVLNSALKENRIVQSPFVNFKISNVKGNIDFLDVEEVQKLVEVYKKGTLTQGKQNVLRFFLFACYTGLRWGDVKALRFNNIKSDGNFKFIEFTQQKTKKFTQVPLIPQAVELIPEQEFKNQKVFIVPPNQTTNNHLRQIIEDLEINKRISFHSARHTCSNLLYRLNIPIEVRSKIVGDTPEVIRERYTDTDLGLIQTAMNQYSEIFNKKADNLKPIG